MFCTHFPQLKYTYDKLSFLHPHSDIEDIQYLYPSEKKIKGIEWKAKNKLLKLCN